MPKEEIYQDFIKNYSKDYLEWYSKKVGESIFGLIIGFLRDYYGLPKPDGYLLAERLEEHYKTA